VDAFTQDILLDIQSGESASDSNGEPPAAPEQDSSDTGAIPTPRPDRSRIEAVKTLYQSGLLALQLEANAMVDRLIASVREDYTALQASGGDTKAVASLALSAMQKAQVLETEVDSSFALINSGMRAELEAANMPKEELISYEEELRSVYEHQKKQRKDAIMDKAKEYL
jgi:hypothetical protein